MFAINKQTDYALITISNLSDKNEYVPLSYLIEKTGMPKRFLARIMAQLVKNHILYSKEGKIGGYKLALPISEISLGQFLKIFEQDLSMVGCQKNDKTCLCLNSCHHQNFFKNTLTSLLSKQLDTWTLADVFKGN